MRKLFRYRLLVVSVSALCLRWKTMWSDRWLPCCAVKPTASILSCRYHDVTFTPMAGDLL